MAGLKDWENSRLEIIFQSGCPEFPDGDDAGSGDKDVEFFVEDKGGLGGREIFDFPSDARKFGSADVSAFPARPSKIKYF